MKIFAAAFNYHTHNKADDHPLYSEGKPVILLRADSSLIKGRRPVFLPDDIGRIGCAAQVVARVCRLGKSIPERFAHRYYDAVTCAATFTATDLLASLRAQGLPWDAATGFDGATAIGEWVTLDQLGFPQSLHFHLDINGRQVMEGDTSDMLHSIDSLISHVSRHFTLRTGDLVLTGAPAPLMEAQADQHVTGYIEGRKLLEFNVK